VVVVKRSLQGRLETNKQGEIERKEGGGEERARKTRGKQEEMVK
jgi:hypothetical protein